MNEKTLMLLGTLGGIIGILPIIAWFIGGSELKGNNRETLRTLVNLEILLIVVGIILCLIPYGFVVNSILSLFNIVISVKAFTAVDKEAFKLPLPEIIK